MDVDATSVAMADKVSKVLPTSHRDIRVSSIIDVHAWDKARWRGCGYLQLRSSSVPYLALLFEEAEPARKIFERWLARFGKHDEQEVIGISIIRDLPNHRSQDYLVQLASNDLP